MSTIKNPVGPQPPSVYWRRRLLLLVGVIAVIVVIVLIVVRPGAASGDGANKDPKGATTSDVKGTPSGSASGAAKAGGTCAPSSVKIVAITDATSYAAGQQPQLSMSITNTGTSACSFDVGTDAQQYVITSGSDTIWSSKDCQTDPAASAQTLEPGKTLTTQPLAWDRTRSSTTTCSGNRTAAVAGGASYHLQVKLGSLTSAETKQFILN
jgi:hypothetical protein